MFKMDATFWLLVHLNGLFVLTSRDSTGNDLEYIWTISSAILSDSIRFKGGSTLDEVVQQLRQSENEKLNAGWMTFCSEFHL